MYYNYVVKNYERTGDGSWSGSPTTVTEHYNVSVHLAEGDLNDSFSFKVNNPRNSRIDDFEQQDNIQIHLCINGESAASSNAVMNGLVKSVEERTDGGKKVLIIKGVSFSEISTNGLVFYTAIDVNVMQFLQGALETIANRNRNFGVTWNSGNPSVKSDGTSFPLINGGGTIKEFDKSLNSILNKYLANEHTEDGNYYWFINNDKELVIRKRDSVFTGELVEGADYKTARYQITDDVRNYIVVKCGQDPNDANITTRYDDPVSRAKYGFKYYVLVTTLGQDIIAEQGFGTSQKYPNSYPYTATFKDPEDDSDVTVTSDSEWVSAVRTEAKRRGVDKGKIFATSHNKGFRNIMLRFAPNTDYNIGDNYKITAPSYALSNFLMRIKEVNYDEKGVDVLLVEEVK